jgi:hypothetical protein
MRYNGPAQSQAFDLYGRCLIFALAVELLHPIVVEPYLPVPLRGHTVAGQKPLRLQAQQHRLCYA